MEGRCAKHQFEASEDVCRECGNEFCSECLVYSFGPKKPPFCIACALAAAGEDAQPQAKPPGSELRDGFTFNSTRKDGRVEWKVAGSSASFLTPEEIELKNVRAIFFSEDGTNTVATTDKAIFN